MKKTKVLVPALGILCLSMAASVTSTFAWFAANQTVFAKNMQVKSSTPASLVIGETFHRVGQEQSITFAAPAAVKALAPATHSADYATYGSGLKYVTNGDLIDPNTGLMKTDAPAESELLYDVAAADTHYVDYTAYLASAGSAIDDTDPKKLSVTMTHTEGATGDTISALSIDFYVKAVTSTSEDAVDTSAPTAEEYRGTLNLAGLDNTVNDVSYDATKTKNSVELISSTATMAIPNEKGESAVRVVMRVYFDGALLKDATHAFVYTNNIDTTTLNIDTTFTIASV